MRTKHLPIAQPCHEDWDAMDRVERGRFCQVCVKQVFDLSTMTEDEVRGLLRDREGSRICVRYQHDDHGEIRLRAPAPRPTPAPANTCNATPRRLAWAGAAMMAVAMAACTPHERESQRVTPIEMAETVEMGDVDVVPLVEPEPHLKGEIEAIEPPKVELEARHVRQGGVGARRMPMPMPVSEPVPVRELKGDMIAPAEPEPCDG